MNGQSRLNALNSAGLAVVILFLSFQAHAAECFDRDTDDPKAGNATAVIGPAVGVERLQRDEVFRPDTGADMFTGDRVSTGDASHLQLKLCDWSTYTFSPNSESAISEFFDARGAGRRRVVNFLRGGFRFSSGRDTAPGSTEVVLQDTGVTMGVRGTNVVLAELDACVYAVLEGPVRDNTGLTRKGHVNFWFEQNREAIEASLKRPGYAVCVNESGVSEPFRADAALLRRIYQAFVPVAPEGEGAEFEYAGNALSDSGQGAQEGQSYKADTEKRVDDEDEQTEQKPEEPFDEEEDDQSPPPPPTIPVGDILPLDVLDDFAGTQATPVGNVFVLAPAQLTIDDGASVTQQDGVVIFQIDIDWQNRTVAPEAVASFVRFDFTVTDPTDLTQRNPLGITPPEDVLDAFYDAVLASFGVPFASGSGGFAEFSTPTFMLTIRQGPGDTVTADVSLDYTDTDGQGIVYTIASAANDVMLAAGEGDLAFFSNDVPLGGVFTPVELEGFASSGTSILTGSSDIVGSTLSAPTRLAGYSVAQLEVNFDDRTVGGGSSFIVISAGADPAIGGADTLHYVSLDQPAAFDSGLFGLAFYTLASLTSDLSVVKGQGLVGDDEGLVGNIAGIFQDGSGNHLYTEIDLFENFSQAQPLSTITGLEGLAATLGSGTFRFNGTAGGRGFSGFAELERADGAVFFGSAEASIDVNFANRMVGGGESFVAVNIDDPFTGFVFNLTSQLNAVSFDDAADGVGVFGFGAGDFAGTNIDNALFLIRDGSGGAGETADLYFNFNDGAGGLGIAEVEDMSRQAGATTLP